MLLVWVSSVTEIKPKKARLRNHFGFHPSCSSTFPFSSVMVSVGLCCPCKYECVPNIKSQLEVRLGVVLAFRAPPYTHAHNFFYFFFLTWCVQGILDLCKQVRIYLSVEMPNGAKWQRRRLVLKRNLSDGFLSNVVFWSI